VAHCAHYCHTSAFGSPRIRWLPACLRRSECRHVYAPYAGTHVDHTSRGARADRPPAGARVDPLNAGARAKRTPSTPVNETSISCPERERHVVLSALCRALIVAANGWDTNETSTVVEWMESRTPGLQTDQAHAERQIHCECAVGFCLIRGNMHACIQGISLGTRTLDQEQS